MTNRGINRHTCIARPVHVIQNTRLGTIPTQCNLLNSTDLLSIFRSLVLIQKICHNSINLNDVGFVKQCYRVAFCLWPVRGMTKQCQLIHVSCCFMNRCQKVENQLTCKAKPVLKWQFKKVPLHAPIT